MAKRRLGAEHRQTVRTEFAFRRDSFRDHGRDPDGLRPIVCRAHDWADCPLPSIEPTSESAAVGRERIIEGSDGRTPICGEELPDGAKMSSPIEAERHV